MPKENGVATFSRRRFFALDDQPEFDPNAA
jgi:hypothetical protein